MYSFKKEGISKEEKLSIVKIFKNIEIALPFECNGSDLQREGVERLLIETVMVLPNILYVYNDKNIGIIDLIIQNKLWGALVEIAKKKEFADEIDQKLIIAKNKIKNKQGKEV